VLGGNENTDQSELSTKAAAIVARSVEIAAMVSQPSSADLSKAQASREHERAKC
jgi:hypothetical protein